MLNERQDKQASNGLPASCFSNPGNRIQPVYTRVYDDVLKREVVKHTSDTDIYELIQESDNSSDITLLKKMINGGQVDAPEDPLAQYGLDLANMPKNIHEVYDQVNHADSAFNSLPDYIKNGFGSVYAFEASLKDGSYYSKVETYANAYAKAEAAKAAAAAQEEKK